MKYIISVDLWLTARIGQLPHLLRSCNSSNSSGNISNWSSRAAEPMLPAHRALGKLHAQARAHATAKLSTYATPTGQTPAHKDTRKNFRGF